MITTIRLPDDLHRKLKLLAGERGLTFNAMVIVVLMEFVKGVFDGKEKKEECGFQKLIFEKCR